MQSKMDETIKAREREIKEELETKIKSQKQKHLAEISRVVDTLHCREQEINELEESLNSANNDKLIMNSEL